MHHWTCSALLRYRISDFFRNLLDAKMDMYALGVLIRLGKTMPASVEDVAPAIFYHTRLPDLVPGYLFTMKTDADARLSCTVYSEERTSPIMTQTFRRVPGGRPFTVLWKTDGSQEGRYRLVCTGFFLDTNQPLQETVRFYHRPAVR